MTNSNQPLDEKAKKREYALINLKDEYLSNIASVAIAKPSEGEMPKYGLILSGLYNETIMKAPNQNAYEQLMRDELLSDEGSLTKARLMDKAKRIIIDSIQLVQIKDILELMGSAKGIKQDYKEKYVEQLSEEERKQLNSFYATYMVNKKAETSLARERNAIVGGLEKKFCEPIEQA